MKATAAKPGMAMGKEANRKVAGNPALSKRFAPPRSLAIRIRFQNQRQRGPKGHSLHGSSTLSGMPIKPKDRPCR
jgi:hypothetical protein